MPIGKRKIKGGVAAGVAGGPGGGGGGAGGGAGGGGPGGGVVVPVVPVAGGVPPAIIVGGGGTRVTLDALAKSFAECDTAKKIFLGFFFIGFFIILLSVVTNKRAKNKSLTYAYSIFIFAILGIIILDINILKNDNENLMKILFNPLLYTIIILLWAIALNEKYIAAKPKQDKTSEYNHYQTWLNKSIILICILIGTSLFVAIFTKREPFIVMYIMVLVIINIIVLIIQQQLIGIFMTNG